MDRLEAWKLDKGFYIEEENGIPYLFGDNSGFAYVDLSSQTKEEQQRTLRQFEKSKNQKRIK